MSKLNINRNIFLEREEILRFQDFMLQTPVNQTFLANTTAWGIIDTSGGGDSNDFKVETGTVSGTIKIANLSRALTVDGLMIKQSAIDNIAITAGGAYYWIKIGHVYSKAEIGTCSVNVNGQVSGNGTLFTEVLRGQSTNAPIKIKFIGASLNTNIYEVVDITDDENLVLAGDTFFSESNLQYYVIGCTPIGETITSEQQNGLYYYDSCQISIVAETTLNTEPAGKITDEEFWIARVVNNSGTVTIQDKRIEYWEYYIKGVSDKLTKTENLADLENKATSRNNLDVYSKSEVNALSGVSDTGYLSMSKISSNIQANNFNIKIRKYGKIVNVQGTYRKQTVLSDGEIAFQISLSSIGVTALPSVDIYSHPVIALEASENRGDIFKINAATGGETNLNILVYFSLGNSDQGVKTINFSYISQ